MDEDDIAADAALTGLAPGRLLAEWRADPDDKEPNRSGHGRAPSAVMRLFPADLAAAYGSVRGYAAELLGAYGSVRGYAAELLGADDEPVSRCAVTSSNPPVSVSPPRAARPSRAPESAHASPPTREESSTRSGAPASTVVSERWQERWDLAARISPSAAQDRRDRARGPDPGCAPARAATPA
nr:hypothetical protein OG781_05455 [Streptomyces sp. NBC_00830]